METNNQTENVSGTIGEIIKTIPPVIVEQPSKTNLNIIVAADEKGCIGIDNDLPWGRIKADMRHFKNTTSNSTVIMGRKTFESMGCKPLVNRINIVLTSDINNHIEKYGHHENLIFINNIDYCLWLGNLYKRPIYIIGGASLYNHFWTKVNNIILTRICANYNGNPDKDAFIKPIDTTIYTKWYSYVEKPDIPSETPELIFEHYTIKTIQ